MCSANHKKFGEMISKLFLFVQFAIPLHSHEKDDLSGSGIYGKEEYET